MTVAGFEDWLLAYAAPVEGRTLAEVGALEIGVGKAAAAAVITEQLVSKAPPGVLLFGVCGAFPARHRPGAELSVGALCLVRSDRLGDEGVETPDRFVDLATLGLQQPVGPFSSDREATAHAAHRLSESGRAVALVDGVTVSTCSGTEARSAAMATRSGAGVETMEGAAVAWACARRGVPLVQLRAVSNFTGDRAQAGWELERAAETARHAVRALLG